MTREVAVSDCESLDGVCAMSERRVNPYTVTYEVGPIN